MHNASRFFQQEKGCKLIHPNYYFFKQKAYANLLTNFVNLALLFEAFFL